MFEPRVPPTALGRREPLAMVRPSNSRSFSFDPSGEFLCCCNQRADHIAVFRVDRKTGGLSFTGQYVPVGNPSMVVFADLAKAR